MDKELTSGDIVCCHCECSRGMHCVFVECPLYKKELICIECCHDEISKEEALSKLKEITGQDLTREALDKICRDCGKRNV